MDITPILIQKLRMNLASTDYIVTKIAEAETQEEQQAIRQQYADILALRKEWRAQINELEEHPLDDVPEPPAPWEQKEEQI